MPVLDLGNAMHVFELKVMSRLNVYARFTRARHRGLASSHVQHMMTDFIQLVVSFTNMCRLHMQGLHGLMCKQLMLGTDVRNGSSRLEHVKSCYQ